MTESIKCAIYARYSSNNQREASIEDQIRKCKEFADARGWEILPEHVYADRAISGQNIKQRDNFKNLLSLATCGASPFNRILVDETSRVARNTKEALDVFSLLTFYNVHVNYVSQGIDTSHESAEEMLTVHGLIDSLYLKNLARETHRGIEGQILKGYSGGGKRYGYRSIPVHNGKVDIYGNPEADGYQTLIKPDEAETVIRIFRMFAEEGLSAKRIVTILNKELKESVSPHPPRGKYWAVSTILGSKRMRRGILNNEIYIGRYYWNCTKTKKNPTTGGRVSTINDKSKWRLVIKPELRIINDGLWQKAKARQKEIKQTTCGRYTKGKQLYSKHLLTGILKCPSCGGNMAIVSGGKYAKYGCSANWNGGESVCSNDNKIPKQNAESDYIASLGLDFLDDEFVKQLIIKVNELLKKKEMDKNPSWMKESLGKELKKTEKELQNILTAIRAGVITPSVTADLQKLESKKIEISNKLTSLPPSEKVSHPSVLGKTVLSYCQNLALTLSSNPSLGRKILTECAIQ
jgi:DNA invertase Pin-like site-specific DNA recombinase